LNPLEESIYILQNGKLPEESAPQVAAPVVSTEAPAAPTVPPAPSLVPGGGAMISEAPRETSADEALRILRMSPDEAKSAFDATKEAGIGPSFSHRLGVTGTGFNATIANALGTIPDIAASTLGQLGDVQRGLNAALPPSMQRYATQPAAPITAPVGGTASLDRLLPKTAPADELDRILYGVGSGLGSSALGLGAGSALGAIGRAPAVAQMLTGGPPTTANFAGNLLAGIGSGAGSVAGGDVAGAMAPNSPAARAVGELGGGLLGGFAGALTPPALQYGARGIGDIFRPFTEEGPQRIAGNILNKSATYGEPQLEPPPLGINPTLGQASNDPGLLRLERALDQSPEFRAALAARASENNQTLLHGAVPQLGQPGGRAPYEISQQAATGLEANRAAARQAEGTAWRAIDPTRSVQVPMQPIRDRMQAYIDDLTMARRPMVPDNIVQMLNTGGDTLPMRELQDIRSLLTGMERTARAGPKPDLNQANVLRNMDEALFQGLPPGAVPMPTTANQAATLRYQNALEASRQYHDTFGGKPIRDIFRVEGTPDSAVLDKMLGPGQGQAERASQYMGATLGNPELVQHGRDWFTARLSDTIRGASQDAQGDPFILGNKLSRFVDTNRPLINSPLFTPDQRNVINDLVEATGIVGRTARAGPPGGSDTAAKLLTNNYVQALVGSWFRPDLAMKIIGTIGGGVATQSPWGAVAGGLGATMAGPSLTNWAYKSAADKVTALLSRAMTDPAFATELMRNASRGNTALASPMLRDYLAKSIIPLTIESGPSRQ